MSKKSKTRKLSVRLDILTFCRLKKLAEKKGWNLSETFRYIVNVTFEQDAMRMPGEDAGGLHAE
jgi:macrodomain Ter protein organizer (MatP/YcbG family)